MCSHGDMICLTVPVACPIEGGIAVKNGHSRQPNGTADLAPHR